MIDSKNISVIVQGAIDTQETIKCLASIRKYLPDSEIILSTWEGSNLEGLDFDKLILNKDPGAELLNDKKLNNVNRQLVSTKNGLNLVQREYSLKLRTDFILDSANFLNFFDQYSKRCEKYKLFKQKILVPAVFSRFSLYNPNNYTLFHPSDFWFFGYTEDLKKYFVDTELVLEPEFTNYFVQNKEKNPFFEYKHRFTTEQYYCYSCFSRYFSDIKMNDASDYDDELIEISKIAIINNFIMLEFFQSGIYTNKYAFTKNEKFLGEHYLELYNQYNYAKEYQRICDNNYQLKYKDKFFTNEKFAKTQLKYFHHLHFLYTKNTTLLKRIYELVFALPFLSLKVLFSYIKK